MTDKPSMEALEDEVDRLADQRRISFSAALALKNGEARRPAKNQVTRADLDELREGLRELQEKSLGTIEMSCGQRFAQMIEDGEIEKHAKERGLPYQDAFAELSEEAYRPHTDAVQSRHKRATTSVVDDAGLNRKVEDYARREGVSFETALDAVLEGR